MNILQHIIIIMGDIISIALGTALAQKIVKWLKW